MNCAKAGGCDGENSILSAARAAGKRTGLSFHLPKLGQPGNRGRVARPGWRTIRGDLAAGITVAMVTIPQAMAYAGLAGVSPLYGLYTAIVPTIVASLFGSSPYLSTGPTNGTALVTAAVLLPLAGQPGYAEYVFALAILGGLLKLLLGIFRLGFIVRFVSNSVLTGFLAGAGVLIMINQLGNLLGLRVPAGLPTPLLIWQLVGQLGEINIYAVITGVVTIGLLAGLHHLNARLPAALIAVVASGALVRLTGWDALGVKLVKDVGQLSEFGLSFHVPQISLGQSQVLLAGALAVTFYSLVEAISVARSLSLSTGQTIDASREFLSQGLASLAGGFCRSIPPSGSISRSAINFANGARTRISGIAAGLLVFAAVLIAGPVIELIPMSSLAGIVIVYAGGMIDRKRMRLTWHSRAISRTVMAVTLGATLLLPLQTAIMLGVALSIAIYLYESSGLEITCLIPDGQQGFREIPVAEALSTGPSVVALNVRGAMYFGAVDDLELQVNRCLDRGVRVIVLRLAGTRLMASSGAGALERLAQKARAAGAALLVSDIKAEEMRVLISSESAEQIGLDRIFPAEEGLVAGTRNAMAYAQRLLSSAEDATGQASSLPRP
jgi:SulP family sulfate permease